MILDNAPGHPEPHESNTEGVKVVYAPKYTSVIQPLGQRVIRIFKAHYTQYCMGKIVNAIEENHDRENIMKVWKEYTIEDAIIVIEKAMKGIKPKTINSCWKKTVQMLCMTSQDLGQSHQRNHEIDCGYGQKDGENE